MMEGVRYIQAGEVTIPDLTTASENLEIGKYGRMRERFLKEKKQGMYSSLVLTGKLSRHLWETNERAIHQIEEITQKLSEKDPGPDKAQDQMGWVRHQNSLRAQAEEMILEEMIYA